MTGWQGNYINNLKSMIPAFVTSLQQNDTATNLLGLEDLLGKGDALTDPEKFTQLPAYMEALKTQLISGGVGEVDYEEYQQIAEQIIEAKEAGQSYQGLLDQLIKKGKEFSSVVNYK
jgi:hypothetical protein